MGSKERILRLKDQTRRNILDSALDIVETGGCDALSMRKLADQIEYSPPVIYEYFRNKECIYLELAKRGHLTLAEKVREAKSRHRIPEKQIEAMWIAYWNFAFTHKVFYQLMYGINFVCVPTENDSAEANLVPDLMTEVIAALFKNKPVSDETIRMKYYTYWAVVHGLISLNIIQQTTDEKMGLEILTGAVKGITTSIIFVPPIN
ncbi:hypothetical protein GCM10023149_22770 [Mucilaginibacter gynuensis]|uniref:HTH tetR-type domain-containing protein n=1 Tax=Mucilaginibacter gynuensis TaxID=1302236 RepID=A0ABP8GDQ0_9SPHI